MLAGDCDVSGVKKVNLVANNGSGARGVSGLVDRHGVARRWCLVGVHHDDVNLDNHPYRLALP